MLSTVSTHLRHVATGSFTVCTDDDIQGCSIPGRHEQDPMQSTSHLTVRVDAAYMPPSRDKTQMHTGAEVSNTDPDADTETYLQLLGVVCAVENGHAGLGIIVGLCPEFTAKELEGICAGCGDTAMRIVVSIPGCDVHCDLVC